MRKLQWPHGELWTSVGGRGAAARDVMDGDDVRLSRGRRYAVRALLALATVLAVVSIFAVWANRQVLHADNWADTSTQLLENEAVRTQVAGFLVDQVYANVDVAGELSAALPPRLDRLAGPTAGALRNAAQATTEELLSRPRVQALWKAANEATAQQFINIAEGDSGALTSSGNAVVLDLRVILVDLVRRLGLPGTAVGRLPEDAGRVTILTSDDVTLLQDGASALRTLAYVLPPLALVLFALAVYLARGRRRTALMWVGIDLVAAGLIVLVARRVAGEQVVASLVDTEAVKPAAEAVWSIATSMLHDVAQAAIVIGIPVVLAAWLAGPARPAVAIRHAIAPWLRDRPELAYGVALLLVLIVVAWGPIPATRQVIPVVVMIALVALGVRALRRQTAEEFPYSMRGGATPGPRGHVPGAGGRGARPEGVAELERLAALHDRGVLTDEEFRAGKTAILATEPDVPAGAAPSAKA